jgi:hypothetical protein
LPQLYETGIRIITEVNLNERTEAVELHLDALKLPNKSPLPWTNVLYGLALLLTLPTRCLLTRNETTNSGILSLRCAR